MHFCHISSTLLPTVSLVLVTNKHCKILARCSDKNGNKEGVEEVPLVSTGTRILMEASKIDPNNGNNGTVWKLVSCS